MIIKRLLFFLFLIATNASAQLLDTLIDVKPYTLHFKIIKGSGTPIPFESGGGMDASLRDNP